ncbi:Uncharacterised protein [Bordetella pertussis]|nr:Uncharacterised protein [Bordetella pertussis]
MPWFNCCTRPSSTGSPYTCHHCPRALSSLGCAGVQPGCGAAASL